MNLLSDEGPILLQSDQYLIGELSPIASTFYEISRWGEYYDYKIGTGTLVFGFGDKLSGDMYYYPACYDKLFERFISIGRIESYIA